MTKVQLRLRFFEQEQWRRGGEKMHVSFDAHRRRNFEGNLNTAILNEKLDIDTRVYFAGASSWNDVIDSLRFHADVH